MSDLLDGESVEMKGSGARPYVLKNTGGVYSCTCPAWRNQSIAIERRTCKHLRKLRGDVAEETRLGGALPQKPVKISAEGEEAGPPLLLAQTWDNSTDLAGWWMSEKLDGVRAYWDGKQFLCAWATCITPRIGLWKAFRMCRWMASYGSAERSFSARSASSGGRTRPTNGTR